MMAMMHSAAALAWAYSVSTDFRVTLREYLKSWRDAYLVEGLWDENPHIPAHGHDRPSLHREVQ